MITEKRDYAAASKSNLPSWFISFAHSDGHGNAVICTDIPMKSGQDLEELHNLLSDAIPQKDIVILYFRRMES